MVCGAVSAHVLRAAARVELTTCCSPPTLISRIPPSSAAASRRPEPRSPTAENIALLFLTFRRLTFCRARGILGLSGASRRFAQGAFSLVRRMLLR